MLLEGEKLLAAVNTHWMKYARPTAIMVLLLPVSIMVMSVPGLLFEQFQLGAYTPFFAGLLLLTIILHWGCHRLLNESMIDVIITNRRVIYLQSSPLFRDVTREFHMERIRAVEGMKKGIMQNIFGYGSMSVNTEGSGFQEGESVVKFMPKPNEYARKIIVAMEEAGISKIARRQTEIGDSQNISQDNRRTQQTPQKIMQAQNISHFRQGRAWQRIIGHLQNMRKKLTGREELPKSVVEKQ